MNSLHDANSQNDLDEVCHKIAAIFEIDPDTWLLISPTSEYTRALLKRFAELYPSMVVRTEK